MTETATWKAVCTVGYFLTGKDHFPDYPKDIADALYLFYVNLERS